VTAWVVWAAKVANALIGFATSVLIARLLGPGGRAEYFLGATVAAGVFATCHLSLDQSIFWAVAEKRASVRRVVKTLAPILLALALGSLGVYWLVDLIGLLGHLPHGTAVVGAFLAPILLGRFLVDAILYTTDRSRLASASLVATGILQLIGIAALAASGQVTSTTVLAVSGASTLLGGIGNAIAVARTKSVGPAGRVGVRSLLGIGLRNHLAVVGLWLALRADVIIVAQLVSKRDLGLYSLAVTLAEVILLATDALALSALGKHRTLERQASMAYSVKIASGSTSIAAIEVLLVAALGWPLILLAYGRSWLGVYPVVLCLAPGTIALAYMRPLGAGFIRAGRALERSTVMVVAAAVNVGGALVATPLFGIVGAAATSTLAYAIGAALLAWRVRASLGLRPWVKARFVWPPTRTAIIEPASGEVPTAPS
jgi:O-antigen/teichoic acid export membrane protein